MLSLFGGLKKAKSKLLATRFQYSFTIHNLNPWPASNKALAVGWQRGKKKRGATRSVYTSTAPGRLGAVVRFNEKFDFSASLYKANNGGTHNQTALGPFKKKCIIMAVLETDGRTQATAALGRVVIDLAEFASINGQQTRTFQVACNRSVQAAVGDPQLTITIRCQWKKSGGPAVYDANGELIDDSNSMSTDTTGSRMTANLSSFLRFKHSIKGDQSNEEQDLQGFPDPRASALMTTIQEGADEFGDSPTRSTSNPASFPSPTKSTPSPMAPIQAKRSLPCSNGDALLGAAAASAAVGMTNGIGGSLRSTHSTMVDGNGHGPAMVVTNNAPVTTGGADTGGGAARGALGVRVNGISSNKDIPATVSAEQISAAESELVVTAAMEVSVYLAKGAAASRPGSDLAPARRLARTITCLGPSQGLLFGQHALKVISTILCNSRADTTSTLFWWRNSVHLRGLLQGTPSVRWAAESLVPELVNLECSVVFEPLLDILWTQHLLPAADPPAVSVHSGSPAPVAAPPLTKRAQQEAAVKRWFEGLGEVAHMLKHHSEGTVAGLRHQLMVQCLNRLDVLLFYHLMSSGPEDAAAIELLNDYGSQERLWGSAAGAAASKAGSARPLPQLHDSSLPFIRGLLSFGTGMSVKMTVTRLQQWASGEGVSAIALSDGSPRTTEALVSANTGSLFPLMRAAADLLMMPKELLMEQAIRRDVCRSLSMRSMIHILENFQADEYAHDVINPELLETLRAELEVSGPSRPLHSECSVGYRPPTDEAVWAKASCIDYGSESEDELEEIGNLLSFGGKPPSRFHLLHKVWSEVAPTDLAM